MTALDKKINDHFPGLVVRKDLVKIVKGNAIVPTYVLEYLLGQYCATSDAESIQSGIDTVKEILRKHYVHRNEAGLVRSTIKERGRHKIIDKVSVALNDKSDCYEASFANLGVKKVLVDTDTVKKHPKLLVSGVWCIIDLEYSFNEDKNVSPWLLSTIKPIQLSHFDYKEYQQRRKEFSTEEWIDLLIQSIGFNPEIFGKRSKLLQLSRLIPYCERNYNLIELGPKGTGKSHIYSEFSPHGILISGGEVTVPKLFVNNATGKIGLVGYWDTVAFDEFAGKKKKTDKALVDIMKNYMANKTFSRGVETLGAEASMVFVGNTRHTLPYMLKHSNLFDELPEKYYDSAFLDRLHLYLPGWEVDTIRAEMFSEGYGFVVDYLAEILKELRKDDFSYIINEHVIWDASISTRDRDAIKKTFSGLMKILYPHGEYTHDDVIELAEFAAEGRKRVKDHLYRIDSTFTKVFFAYKDLETSQNKDVKTLEEVEYSHIKYVKNIDPDTKTLAKEVYEVIEKNPDKREEGQEKIIVEKPEVGQFQIRENQSNVSFDKIFSRYLRGASRILLQDPYIHKPYQMDLLIEFCSMLINLKSEEDEIALRLITKCDFEFTSDYLSKIFDEISDSLFDSGIKFTYKFADQDIHDRYIKASNGWKIILGRGLDIFQRPPGRFNISKALQEKRKCKACEITYLRDVD